MKNIWLWVIALFSMWQLAKLLEQYEKERVENLKQESEDFRKKVDQEEDGAWKSRLEKITYIAEHSIRNETSRLINWDNPEEVVMYRRRLSNDLQYKFKRGYAS